MLDYIKRLLDANDRSADLLMFGVFLGFISFVIAVQVYLVLFVTFSIWPKRVTLDSSAFVAAMVGLGGMYSAVLGATTAAYRWRKNLLR